MLTPRKTLFLQCNHQGKEGLVPEFLPFTEEEKEFNRKNEGTRRVVLWPFGGLIKDTPRTGWLLADVQQTVRGPGLTIGFSV